ncbi:MAG: HAMP domain-containing histidine kinase [Gemmatimonadetes bacterium]|nr:HAMP domain-containing histidine kinase [Gemmatimonadota bacterium]
MLRIRSFQTRVFLAMVTVAVVPAVIAVGLGALALREVGSTTGTLGAWDAVAESGRALLAAVEGSPDPEVSAAAAEHREALSASVRWSRLYALVTERLLRLLPLAAAIAALVIAGLSALAARRLARDVARPVAELVDWTRRIARGEPLPATDPRPSSAGELEQLRGALRTMAADLETGRRREVEAARLRTWTEMARRLAHEIKNPLTPMRMAAAGLARREDPAVSGAAAVLMEEIDRLDDMARGFAQLGGMPQGPPSEVDLEELARSVAATWRDAPVAVSVRSEGPVPRVLGHYELLARAVRNLVVNAVEAQQGTGEVEVVVGADGDGGKVSVLDRGPGVPEELRQEVWMPHVTTKSRGTGLGLALVRQAATAHGGRAEVEARPGGGSRFTLALPAEPRPGDASGAGS